MEIFKKLKKPGILLPKKKQSYIPLSQESNFVVYDYSEGRNTKNFTMSTHKDRKSTMSTHKDNEIIYKLECVSALNLKLLLEVEMLKNKPITKIEFNPLIPLYKFDEINAPWDSGRAEYNIQFNASAFIFALNLNTSEKITATLITGIDDKKNPVYKDVDFNNILIKQKNCDHLTKRATFLKKGNNHILIRHFQEPVKMIKGCKAYITCEKFKELETFLNNIHLHQDNKFISVLPHIPVVILIIPDTDKNKFKNNLFSKKEYVYTPNLDADITGLYKDNNTFEVTTGDGEKTSIRFFQLCIGDFKKHRSDHLIGDTPYLECKIGPGQVHPEQAHQEKAHPPHQAQRPQSSKVYPETS